MKIIRQKVFGQIWDKVKVGATLGLMTGAIPGSIIIKHSKDVKGIGAGLGTAVGGMALGAGVGLYKGIKDKRIQEKNRAEFAQISLNSNPDTEKIIKLRKALWKFDDIEGLNFYKYLKKNNTKLFNEAMNVDSSLGLELFDLDIPEVDFQIDYESTPEGLENLYMDGKIWDFLDIKIRLGDDIYKYRAWTYDPHNKTFELYNWCHRSFANNENLIKACKSTQEFKEFIIKDLQSIKRAPTISDKDCWENTSNYIEISIEKSKFLNIRKELWKYIQRYISEIINIIQRSI